MIPVHAKPADDAGAARFACTLCGDCCATLKERPGRREWPAHADALAANGLYALPSEGGLQVWSWERHRMRAEAEGRGLHVRFTPTLAVADAGTGRLVTLVYELDHAACPFLAPGPAPGTRACVAYDARPLVCRAFPVLLSGGALTVSAKCPGAPAPPPDERDGLAAAYGRAFHAADASGRVGAEVRRLLAFLDTAGVLRPEKGLPRDAVEARLAAGPVDLWEHAAASGAVDLAEWWRRLTGGDAFTPWPWRDEDEDPPHARLGLQPPFTDGQPPTPA